MSRRQNIHCTSAPLLCRRGGRGGVTFLLSALVLFTLFCGCSSGDDEIIPTPSVVPTNQYLQLNIVVSTGSGITRGVPAGGENGDGREAGFERENAVTGITLMLYEDAAGINTSADTKLAFVRYYPVTYVSRETQGNTYSGKTDEAVYTTGSQPLSGTGLDLSKVYHAIIVANANMVGTFTTDSKVKDARDYQMTHLYTGSGLDADAERFVMSSETDYTINFPATSPDASNTYHFDGIRIERMAARIDFSTQYDYYTDPGTWTSQSYGAVYSTTDKSSNSYAYPGYVYPVYKSTDVDGKPSSNDRFVVTAVVPFNVSLTNTGCKEFLIKRTDDASDCYLADESTTNWVIDPQRAGKTSSTEHPSYLDYNLTTLTTTLSAADPHAAMAALANYKTMASYQTSSAKYSLTVSGSNTADNMIVAYPKENTLLPATPLYYYATGLAIEGYYYANDDATATPTRYVYVGYLRHQGESTSAYPIIEAGSLDKSAVSSPSIAMNFGVVRNNIYRVNISKINEKGEMELKIKVKKWDTFIHDLIYM